MAQAVTQSQLNPSFSSSWNWPAAEEVGQAYSIGESNGWRHWVKHLSKRSEPAPLWQMLDSKSNPLAWTLRRAQMHDLFQRLLERRPEKRKQFPPIEQQARRWLEHPSDSQQQRALEALAWAHALPVIASSVEPQTWWQLLEHLVETCRDATAIAIAQDPLLHQWMAGELPITLAYLFPELKACTDIASAGRLTLSQGLADLLDGEGLIQAKNLSLYRPLAACWTRCRAMGAHLQDGCWAPEAEEQFQWLIRQTFRLLRRDGGQVFDYESDTSSQALLQALTCMATDEGDKAVAQHLLERTPLPKRTSAVPEPAVHSEWSELGLLRAGWSRGSERLAVAYRGDQVRTEFAVGREVLWSGVWDLEVTVDGRTLGVDGGWEEVCWISDSDVDYLELEGQLQDGVSVQRQMLLARKERFLLLADAVLGNRPANLQYKSSLPLAAGISFAPAEESREGFLEGRKYRGLAMPLALPEWRSDPRWGRLSTTEQGLELYQHAAGQNLFAPLWIDLDPKRMLRDCTWRQLTVAQTREIQPRDVAAGYRVQVGKQQWLVYRSLVKAANRTLLGHNLISEFVVGRFSSEGLVSALVEIE